jgi:hypothetical protein
MTRTTSLTAIGLIVTIATTVAAQDHTPPATALDKLGTVHFPTSCSWAAQPQFD